MTRLLGGSVLLTILVAVSSFQPSATNLAWSTKSTRPATTLNAAGFSSALAVADAFWQNSPYAAAALTCGFKASAADLVAQGRGYQTREGSSKKALDDIADETTKTADWRQNLAFLLYGAVYQGIAQEFIYNHMYPFLFGAGVGLQTVLCKVSFDLLIQTTLLTLPIAYMSKAIIYQYSFTEAFRRYIDDIKHHGLLTKYYSLWGPVQCITFSIVPVHYRVTFIAFVSFFWLIVLSSIASKRPVAKADECSLVDGQTCNIDG